MNLKYSIIFILTVLLFACSKKEENKSNTPFQYTEKNYSINTKLVMPQLSGINADFTNIMKTVLYKNILISISNNGGFICLDANSLKIYPAMNKKLNTGYFTNLSLFQDTLITEKDSIIYYLNSDFEWVEYNKLLPIKYFDILYDDSHFVFYFTDCGEWDAILFIYDKNTKLTFVNNNNVPVNVFGMKTSFFINTYNSAGVNLGIFFNLINLELINGTIKVPSNYFDCNQNYIGNNIENSKCYNCIDLEEYYKIYEHYRNHLKVLAPPAILSSFIYKGSLFHFVQGIGSIYISRIENNEYIAIQTIREFEPVISRKFGNTVIMNEYYGGDVILVRNDSITRIHFNAVK